MDEKLVKNEVDGNGIGRPLAMATDTQESNETVKFIKRIKRRSEPAFLATATDGNREIIDRSTATSNAVKRSSRFRGVSRHRWTGRFEAHLWDRGSWNATQRKKGKQVYLGAYDEEEAAARAYDLAALKYWGPATFTNFPVSDYEKEIQIMQSMTKEEYLASLRRKSSGFSRGISKYRGVARHHHNGRWEARIGRVFGNKYLYLGTYSTQEEAAHAYDIAAIEYRGINAVTNFDLSTYIRWLRPGATNSLNYTQVQHVINREAHAEQPLTNLSAMAESGTLSHRKPFVSEDTISPCKQEFEFPCGGSSSKSSPTALSLLFKSSMFRRLLEKNSNEPGVEEIEGEDVEDRRQQLGADKEYHQVFYQGIADASCGYSPNGNDGQGIELQESISCNERSDQEAIWNGSVKNIVASLQ